MKDDELWLYHVRTALAHLYDPVQLETHPLSELLGLRPQLALRPGPAPSVSETLRKILRDAIESLRPTTPFTSAQPEWVGYRILQMRYLYGDEVPVICRELALSEATFYRRHRQALEAVTSVLQARAIARDAVPPMEGARSETGRSEAGRSETGLLEANHQQTGREEAVKLARQAPREIVDLRAVVDDAALILIPLAAERGVALHLEVPDTLPPACLDRAMFHQIVLNILMEGLHRVAGNELALVVRQCGDETEWRLAGLRPTGEGETGPGDSPELALSQSLLDVYGGRLWFERSQGQGAALCFALPCAAPLSILLIDDDRDTVELYRRYLQSAQYHVRAAPSGAALTTALSEGAPDMILLDVLMPREDGWKLLQRLKTAPETRDIPVVICSVLSQPGLALALGAARVLHKPIDRQTLVQTVQQVLQEARSSGE